jgi:hypothetical protein
MPPSRGAAGGVDAPRLQSKLRAIALDRGQPDFFPRLLRQYEDASSGQLDCVVFVRAIRDAGRVAPRALSDEDLRDIFALIDKDHDGLVDSDEVAIWFGLSRTQRTALPALARKSTPGSGANGGLADPDELAKLAKAVEEAAANIEQASKPPGLTKFWYKQHTACVQRCVRASSARATRG